MSGSRHISQFPPRRRSARSAIALAVAGGLLLTGCGGSAPENGAADGAADGAAGDGTVSTGGTLTVAIANDPISLNPAGGGSGNDAMYVTRQIVDSLLDQDPETGEVVPWLATDWELNDDATEFTFELREDVTFSDGTEFTAESVQATFDDIVDNGALAAAASTFFGAYEGTEVLGDHEVRVNFGEPNAPFLQALTQPSLAPLAQATLDVPFEDRNTEGVIGTGPFVLENYTPNVEVVLTKREGYDWASEVAGHEGEAALDGVTFTIAPEASVRTGSLTSGAVDVIGGVAPNDQSTLEQAGFPLIIRGNPGTTFGLTPYNDKPIVSEFEVRRAVSLALDRVALRDAVLNEDYAVSRSVLSDTTPGFTDVSEHLEYDLEEANRLLESADWELGSDGIRERDGERLSLVLGWQTNFVANQATVELIQQQVREVGIELDLVSGTVPETTEREEAGELDFRYGNSSRSDGDVLRTSFSAATIAPNRAADAPLDELLGDQRAIVDIDERNEVLAQAQERIVAEALHIPTYQLTTVLGTGTHVHGVHHGADSRLASLVTAWIDQ